MDALQTLLAIEDIRAVKARYCRCLDTKDWDGFARLFTDDAVMDVREDTGNPPISGIPAIIAQVRFAVDHAATSHQVHTPEIALDSPDTAHAVWAMQDRVVWQQGQSPVSGIASITGYGQYHESYRREGGVWKIAALRLSRFHVDMHPQPH
ncbi:nuclear transport factor 2 family protein [Novosphingobium sp. Fuku2-ISO-50]|uniref:nuclear transport factor 2 family protein n=1 Tax=Novosphingobium sp. Fuku2-ISO-50 TaxID=1739114 RepID=UPI00076C388C|nr:nuclear transport factor 2 family protein [Novosphingobium sp. Fuku2-ISO-50]KUR76658.1 bile-acid 7-alpha dehydratase [Novosphingobium sp. Fuku2-ISO-50]